MSEEAAAPQRPLFMVIPSAKDGSGYTIVGPYLMLAGFDTKADAFDWLAQFFDNNARRAADLEQEAAMDRERLALEREEMLIRSLEPKAAQ